MTVPAIHFEAKKYSLRQAKDGVVVSFVVHPNDVRPELLSAPIGEHYIVALAPYTEEDPAAEAPKAKEPPAADAKPKERWADMKRVKQAGIACDDPRFQAWADRQEWPPGTREHADAVWGRERNPNKWFGVYVCAMCGTSSRRHLDTDEKAGLAWIALYDRYLRETGQQTEMRG